MNRTLVTFPPAFPVAFDWKNGVNYKWRNRHSRRSNEWHQKSKSIQSEANEAIYIAKQREAFGAIRASCRWQDKAKENAFDDHHWIEGTYHLRLHLMCRRRLAPAPWLLGFCVGASLVSAGLWSTSSEIPPVDAANVKETAQISRFLHWIKFDFSYCYDFTTENKLMRRKKASTTHPYIVSILRFLWRRLN